VTSQAAPSRSLTGCANPPAGQCALCPPPVIRGEQIARVYGYGWAHPMCAGAYAWD
jgi:hypothetical protein